MRTNLNVISREDVELQLFEAVYDVCVLERDGEFPDPKHEAVKDWTAQFGGIGLRETNLDKPLEHPRFGVVRATLMYGDKDSAYAVTVDSTRGDFQETERVDYDTDDIVWEVLQGFRAYLQTHPHDVCVRDNAIRRERAKEARIQAIRDELMHKKTA